MRSSLASIVLLNVIEPSLDFTCTPPKQSIVSDDNSDPENFDSNGSTIPLSLELVYTITSVIPNADVDSSKRLFINLE